MQKKHNLLIIEDSADTLGATINNFSSGKFSDISITSFYGSHIINCAGNGGMVCFNNKKIYNRAKLLRSWGRSSSLYQDSELIDNRFNIELDGIKYDKKFVFEEIGYQLEPSEISAAFGLVQLKKLNKFVAIRRSIFKKHYEFFSQFRELFIMPNENKNAHTGWLAFPLIIKENNKFDRTQLQIFFEKRNIQTRVIFTGNLLRQPGFKKIKCKGKADDFINSDIIMRGGILIGCHQGLDDEKINHIHDSFKLFIDSH